MDSTKFSQITPAALDTFGGLIAWVG